ncbi:protein DMP3-like [Carex rostrata]
MASSSSSSLIQRPQATPTSPKTETEETIPAPKPKPTNQSAPPQTLSQQLLTSTANLANLLPTGTLLAFQLLTPVFTHNGSCDHVTYQLTRGLLALLACSCFLASLTDSWRSPQDGQVYYGLATRGGMWLFNYSADYPPTDLSKYKLKFIDLIHAVLSVLVFGAVALRDKNVISCFYPNPGQETQEVLDIIPLSIGVLCSLLFVVFPTRRHGIGYPVTNSSQKL